MATLAEQAALAGNSDFQTRVRMAIIAAAMAALTGDQEAAGAAARRGLAQRVLDNPEHWARQASLALATDPTIAAAGTDATDEQIVTAVAAVVTSLAWGD